VREDNTVVRRDGTVAHNRQLYQIEPSVHATQIIVEEHLDGTMRITHQGRSLAYHSITSRPLKGAAPAPLPPSPRPVKPTPAHPWPRRFLPEHHNPASVEIVKQDISTGGESGHF
jgi:hypothetical protein